MMRGYVFSALSQSALIGKLQSTAKSIIKCSVFIGVIYTIVYFWLPILNHIPFFDRTGEPKGFLSARFAFANTSFTLIVILLATLLLGWLDRRSLADYGLPVNVDQLQPALQGAALAALTFSSIMAILALLGCYTVTGFALHGWQAVGYALLWAVIYMMTGLEEEIAFRGYPLITLASSIGFWPAAFMTSILFGFAHASNLFEDWQSEILIITGSLTVCLFRWLTGSLWFAVGLHAMWDYVESTIFSVPDSGVTDGGHLLETRLHGPAWLTGGAVGPEDSAVTYGIDAVILLFTLLWLWRSRSQESRG